MLTRLYATTRILVYTRQLDLVCLIWSVCALPILTGSCAHRAKLDGAFGQDPTRLTIAYHTAHARSIGFWFGRGGLYQLLPYITMPPI